MSRGPEQPPVQKTEPKPDLCSQDTQTDHMQDELQKPDTGPEEKLAYALEIQELQNQNNELLNSEIDQLREEIKDHEEQKF